MARIDKLLDEYDVSHRHPINKLLHWVCVPLIVWSLLALLWSIKVPAVFLTLPISLDWATILVGFSMFYYFKVSKKLAVGILLVFFLMLISINGIAQTGMSVWKLSLLIFVVAWMGQFIGHSIEGKRPSFFKDIQFLLIGPLWLLSFIYKRLGIAY